jgi:hypothetical protein
MTFARRSGLLSFFVEVSDSASKERKRMITGMSAATPSRALRRITKDFGRAVVLVTSLLSPADAHVATTTPTLITIPPAKLPPLPTTEASTAAAVATTAAACELLSVKLQILHDPSGTGLAMYGALSGRADSAAGALLTLFTHLPTFDPAAVAQLLLADHDDRRAQALFTAMVRGTPVIGIAVAALGGPGGDIAIFYDDADAFPASFTRLQQAFAPSVTVEIGMSDNSVYEADVAAENNPDANWNEAIAVVAKGGEAPIDAGLGRAMADKVASDTGQPWHVVSPATLR